MEKLGQVRQRTGETIREYANRFFENRNRLAGVEDICMLVQVTNRLVLGSTYYGTYFSIMMCVFSSVYQIKNFEKIPMLIRGKEKYMVLISTR